MSRASSHPKEQLPSAARGGAAAHADRPAGRSDDPFADLFIYVFDLRHVQQQPDAVVVFAGVVCVDISIEAKLLVAGLDDGMVVVWSLYDYQLVHTLLGHTGESGPMGTNTERLINIFFLLCVCTSWMKQFLPLDGYS